MGGEGETDGKAGELVVWKSGDGGHQNLLRGLPVVLVVADDVGGYIFGEIEIQVDERVEKDPQLLRD